MRKGIIYQIAVMTPRKPNSAKRTFAKLKVMLQIKRFLLKYQE
jgi:ribosomal protein S12